MSQSKERVRIGPANFISQLFFIWVFRFIYKLRSSKVQLKNFDFFLRKTETAELNDAILEKKWQEELSSAEKNNRNPQIRRAVFKAYGLTFFLNGIWKIIWGIALWLGAYWLLKQTISFVRSKSDDLFEGHMYALGFLLSSLVASIAIHQLLSESGRLGLRIKSALMVQIFKKSLVLARIKGGAGDIVNLVSNDCQKVADACTNLQYLWSAVLEVAAIVIISFVEIQLSAVPALFIILGLIPIQIYLGRFKSKTGFEYTAITSKRVHIMSEILTAIKLIKFYAWELPFYDRVVEIRKREMEILKKHLIANSINFMLVFCVPVLVALFALLVFWKSGNIVNPVIGFTVVSVFNTLRYPLLMAPLAINSASDSITALKRLDDFFAADEIKPAVRHPLPHDTDVTIDVKNVSFTWGSNKTKDGQTAFNLKDISFTARKGKVTAIVGDVGSGKSSLLAALLGQMNVIKGEYKVSGSICYVPQEAWLLNMSLRDNIVFGSEFDQEKYNKVIKVCALTRDIELMTDGDRTEIGERGINVSGGQRQRISLARCVYKKSDNIFLDDPLSAVDQQVGKHIFTHCIKDYFKDKTVLFVTHQLQYLHLCDEIIVVSKGEIVEQGTFDALMARKGHMSKLISENVQLLKEEDVILEEDKAETIQTLDVEHFFNRHNSRNKSNVSLKSQRSIKHEDLSRAQTLNRASFARRSKIMPSDNNLAKIIEYNQFSGTNENSMLRNLTRTRLSIASSTHSIEEVVVPSDAEPMKLVLDDQSVNYKVSPFLSYLKVGYGIVITVLIIIFFFFVHLIRILSDYWLSQWFAKSTGKYPEITDGMFVGVYGGAVVLFTIGILLRGIAFSYSTIRKSADFHNKMFKSVIFARMSFFDSTPIGRILNAFARHQYAIDAQLADSLMQLLQYTPLTLGAIILIMAVMYHTIGVFAAALLISVIILLFLGDVENKLRNEDAISKSTIFSHLTATLQGLFSIRAYQCEKRFIDLINEKIDNNHKYVYSMMEVKCWCAFYFDVLTSFMIYCTVIIVVHLRKEYPAATSGLVLSNILQLLIFLQWAIRMFGEVRDKLTSVKQVTYYGNEVPQEPPAIIESNRPPKEWPQSGNVKFDGIVLKYHEFGVAVLKGITVNIKPKEKVGIVGRTGSGKTTLLTSLLRIVESCEGKIVIDGIDISKIGLLDLRSRIAIIPQEPILFVGTIRENVDLFIKSNDEEIWRALDAVHLGDSIRKMDKKLDSEVIENGKNFSVGQRQLFCIARAILSKTQILVLDEATAAIDLQTEKLIQKTLKTNFKDTTILTIAHRLNTVMESDKILVMDAGRVVEFAPPLALLKLPEGEFTSLLKQTGNDSFNKLKRTAEEYATSKGIDFSKIDIYSDNDNIVLDKKAGINIVTGDIVLQDEIVHDNFQIDKFTNNIKITCENELIVK